MVIYQGPRFPTWLDDYDRADPVGWRKGFHPDWPIQPQYMIIVEPLSPSWGAEWVRVSAEGPYD